MHNNNNPMIIVEYVIKCIIKDAKHWYYLFMPLRNLGIIISYYIKINGACKKSIVPRLMILCLLNLIPELS
jgi:hypothetical protein